MKIKKFQNGGAVSPEAADPAMAQGVPMEQRMAPEEAVGAPAPGAEQDPLMMIGQAAMEALQTQNCELALQVCDAFLQLLQQAQGGMQQAPVEEAPQGEPMFKCGGKLKGRKVKKAAKGCTTKC